MKHEKIISKLDLLDESLNDLEFFIKVLQKGSDDSDRVEKGKENKKDETTLADFLGDTPEQIQCLIDRIQTARSNLVSLVDSSPLKTILKE